MATTLPASPLLPAVAMVGLTAMVWARLFVVRIQEMRKARIAPQAVATSRQAAQLLHQVKESDNFKNLFEVPVLFYALCTALAATGISSTFFQLGCWSYVVLRAAHSAIHCTYNNVMHRFAAYTASTLLLFALWTCLGVTLMQQRES